MQRRGGRLDGGHQGRAALDPVRLRRRPPRRGGGRGERAGGGGVGGGGGQAEEEEHQPAAAVDAGAAEGERILRENKNRLCSKTCGGDI